MPTLIVAPYRSVNDGNATYLPGQSVTVSDADATSLTAGGYVLNPPTNIVAKAVWAPCATLANGRLVGGGQGDRGRGTGVTAYPDDGELKLEVDGKIVSGWQNIRITRGIERCPSDFDISVTEKFPGATQSIVFGTGDVCRVRIGKDLVLTGYLDRYVPRMTAADHSVRVMGRSACADIVDCSVDYRHGVINDQFFRNIATLLCEPYGVTVTGLAGPGSLVPQLVVNLGETPYQVIERLARYSGMLVFDDPTGNLVLAYVGTEKMASGAVQGSNVLEASVEFALDQRYSRYHAFRNSVDSLSDYSTETGIDGNEITTVTDDAMAALKRPDGQPRVRELAVISEQMDMAGDAASRRANYEKRHRYGRSQAVKVTLDSWRDTAGKLWEPNYRMHVSLPALKVDKAELVIGEVSYIRDDQGTRAQLTLMAPEAYEPEPVIMNMFDWQIRQDMNGGSESGHDDGAVRYG